MKENKPNIEELHKQAAALIESNELAFPEKLLESFLGFSTLAQDGQLELINKLSMSADLPPLIRDFITAFTLTDALPNEMIYKIGSYIQEQRDMSALVQTNKRMYALFQPDRILTKFLECVAYGNQDKAERVFTSVLKDEKRKQDLLCGQGTVTDYSGRTFKNISAYEYAYWAKDTHMCRMLEHSMNEETKAEMSKRCDAIERDGLAYIQGGEAKNSKHFDLTPLITALQNYSDGYPVWSTEDNDALEIAWLAIGKAQRDLPVHVINEYCRPDRSFSPLPAFDVNEDKLPRVTEYLNFNNMEMVDLYPLIGSFGLGVNCALMRAENAAYSLGAYTLRMNGMSLTGSWCDLEAVSRLDVVRTAELTQSRENLKPIEPEHGLGYSIS